MSFESEKKFEDDARLRRNKKEGREVGFESKENKENQEEKELEAKEKMEQTVVEVKNTKQRMQNIMINMQQVIQAVRAIRQQLQIATDEDEIPSVKSDKKNLEELKKKLAGLEDQIGDLRGALKQEEITQLREMNPAMSDEQLGVEAEKRVEKVMAHIIYST